MGEGKAGPASPSQLGYAAAEADSWLQEVLLVPKKQRKHKLLVRTREEEEEDILRAAELANQRLKHSAMSRCPTGRLPGLGTCKSEQVLIKYQQQQQMQTHSREEADKAFQEWLRQKKAQHRPATSLGAAEALPDPVTRLERIRAMSEAEREQRKREAEQRFAEWKRAKLRELKARAQTSEGARAPEGQVPSGEGGGSSDLAIKRTPPFKPTSPQTGAEVAAPVRTRAGVALVEQLGKRHKARFAPYLVSMQRPQTTDCAKFAVPMRLGRDARRAQVRAVRRVLMHLRDPEHGTAAQAALKESPLDVQVSGATLACALKAGGLDLPESEADLVVHYFAKMLGREQFSPAPMADALSGKEEGSKAGQEEKEESKETQDLEAKDVENSVPLRFCDLLEAFLDAKIPAAAAVAKPRQGKASPVRRRNKPPACAERVSNALAECISQLRGAASDAQVVSKEALLDELTKLLQDNLDTSLALLRADMKASCSVFWKRRGDKSLLAFIMWLEGLNGRTPVTVETGDIRAALRGLFDAIEGPRTVARVTTALTQATSGTQAGHQAAQAGAMRKHIEGTIWLELMANEPFAPPGVGATSEVSSDSFVSYWVERFAAYEKASLGTTSPTHRPPRVSSASRRGRRQANKEHHSSPKRSSPKRSSPKRSSPKRSSQTLKLRRQQQLEEQRHLESVYCRQVVRGTGKSKADRERSGIEREKRMSEAHREHIKMQAIRMQVRLARSALAASTTEHVLELLNLQQASSTGKGSPHAPLQKPPADVGRVLKAVCILCEVTPTWKSARRMLKAWPAFLETVSFVSGLPPRKLEPEQQKELLSLAAAIEAARGPQPARDRPFRVVRFMERWVLAIVPLMRKLGCFRRDLDLETGSIDAAAAAPAAAAATATAEQVSSDASDAK